MSVAIRTRRKRKPRKGRESDWVAAVYGMVRIQNEARDPGRRGQELQRQEHAWSWRDSKVVGGVGQWGKEVGNKVTAKEPAGISLGLLSLASQCRGRSGERTSPQKRQRRSC